MSRLNTQLHRLFGLGEPSTHTGDQPTPPIKLMDDQGQVRAVVLTMGRPADWSLLAGVWQGIQTDLGLPAPAIAVNGHDAYQLWFSLQAPLHASRALAFLEALRKRYLPEVAPHRISLTPSDPQLADTACPPGLVSADQWAAFVAADLAPMFNDTPWLDLPPNQEGQAELLSRLSSIKAVDLDAAMVRLGAPQQDAPVATSAARHAATEPCKWPPEGSPRRFLLSVMNNETVAMQLRIEAAKALLPYEHGP